MTRSGGKGVRPLAAALAQVGAGSAAHVVAAGCLPSAASMAVSLPMAVLGVLAVGGLLRTRPLLALAAGQLTVHACLAVAACRVAAAGHVPHAAGAHGADHLLMTGAHVTALVLCRATADAVLRSADAATAALARLLTPSVPEPRLRLPELAAPVPTPRPALRPGTARHARPPRRGPPAGRPSLLPA